MDDSEKMRVITEQFTARFIMTMWSDGDSYNRWMEAAEDILYLVAPKAEQVKQGIWTIREAATYILGKLMENAYTYSWNPTEGQRIQRQYVRDFSFTVANRNMDGVTKTDSSIPYVNNPDGTWLVMKDMMDWALGYVDYTYVANKFIGDLPPEILAEVKVTLTGYIEIAMMHKKEWVTRERIADAMRDTVLKIDYEKTDARDIASTILRCVSSLLEGHLHPGYNGKAEFRDMVYERLIGNKEWWDM